MNVNALARAGFTIIWHSARGLALRCKTSFWSSPIFGRKMLRYPSTRSPAQCESGPEIPWLVRVTIYCNIFNNNSPPLR